MPIRIQCVTALGPLTYSKLVDEWQPVGAPLNRNAPRSHCPDDSPARSRQCIPCNNEVNERSSGDGPDCLDAGSARLNYRSRVDRGSIDTRTHEWNFVGPADLLVGKDMIRVDFCTVVLYSIN